MSRELIDQFDDERKSLARRLHDEALQQLAALQIHLSFIPTAGLPAAASRALSESSALITSCSREVRAVCGQLHPPLLEQAGLAAAIRMLAEQLGRELCEDFPDDIGPLPDRIAIGAFRIIESLLDDSTPRQLKLRRDEKTLQVAGLGQVSPVVRERVAALDGEILSSVNGGNEAFGILIPLTSSES